MCRHLLASKTLSSHPERVLLDGRKILRHALLLRERDAPLGQRLKRRVRSILRLNAWQDIIDDDVGLRVFGDDSQYAAFFGALIEGYSGAPGHLAVSKQRIDALCRDLSSISAEDYTVSKLAKNAICVFVYEEFLVQRSIALLLHANDATKFLENSLAVLPESDLYIFFDEVAEVCHQGVINRRNASTVRHLSEIDTACRLSRKAHRILERLGRTVITVGRDTDAEMLSQEVANVLKFGLKQADGTERIHA